MNWKAHWETVYEQHALDEMSWYQPATHRSLALISHATTDRAAPIIDVGGGASLLVDELLADGYSDVTVLDLSAAALDAARTRLATQARGVRWIEADVLDVALPSEHFDVWHDRAVFHFLTSPVDRERYVGQVRRAVRPGGYVLVATFAADGPTRCSGLDVARYTPEALHGEFGHGFELLASEREEHHTPTGAVQAFTYCLCRWEGAAHPAAR